jgi:rhodanese-related sulfurtransferase
MRFIVESYRIAWRIWGEGLSQNAVWTGGNSPLIFQHPDRAANLLMAREVIRRWKLGEGRKPLSKAEAAGRYRKGKANNQVETCLQAMEAAKRACMILDTEKGRLFTTGYTGKKPDDLLALAELNDAVVVDIRKSADSRWPHWKGAALADLLGGRYRHVPQLGNNNYKSGGQIVIADIEAGARIVLAIRQPVIMLCACERDAHCHRRVVADALRAQGYEVRELKSWTHEAGTLF